jgi:PAS domain S-box-containing protein
MNTTSIHRNELPSSEVAPSSQNGHSPGGVESSRGVELNAQLMQENAKLAQENAQLVQERDLLRTLFDNLPDNMFVKDRLSRFLVSNLAHVRTLGATHPDEVLGKTDRDIFPAELANQYYEDEQTLMKSGQPLNREETVANPRTGEKRWVQTTKVPLRDKQGAVVGLMGINRDITDRKQAEEGLCRAKEELEKRVAERTAEISHERLLLRTLIDNLPDIVFIKDAQSRFTMLNMACAQQLGASRPEDVLGKSDADFVTAELAAQYRADEQSLMQSGKPVHKEEPTQFKGTGEIHWSLTSKIPMKHEDGRIIGLIGIARDITKHKHAEQALVQERTLLRTLIDNLPDCIYAKDATGRKILANPADLRNLRCKTEAEAIGKSDFDLFPKDIAEKFWADDQKVIQGQPVVNREEFFLNGEGEKQWLLTSKLPLRDQSGKIVGLVGVGRDITHRKHIEQTLAHERTLLRTLIDNLPDCIYAKDQQGRFVLNNVAHAHDLGVKSPAELKGKSDADFFPQELAAKFYADEQKIIETGQPVYNQEQCKSRPGDNSGKKYWSVSTKVLWRDHQGTVLGTVGVTRDIHQMKLAQEALRQSEERLREVMRRTRCILNFGEVEAPAGWREHALDPVSPFRWDFPVVNVEAAQEVFPLDLPPDKQYQQVWSDSRNSDDFKRMIQVSGEAFLHDSPFYRNQFRCTDKQGVERWMQQFVTINKLAENRWQLFGITTDITDLKETENALRSSEDKLRQFTVQLERSNRELQDFAYVASHDLQEPLRKIVVFGERLKEKNSEALGPEALDYLDRMQKAAARMQILINDLLTFSRVTTKAHPFTQVNLAEIASEVVNDLEGRIELVKGRVELGTLPVIDAEALQMRQLLQNLIGNALKFRRPEEPPVVKVEAQIIPDPVEPAKKLCQLTVSDNCIGFDEKYLDRIFNVFQRLHTRNEYEGTGMGLAIVRKIALYHGGDITAKSKPGQGSTFILTIPVAHPKRAKDENTETTTKKEN